MELENANVISIQKNNDIEETKNTIKDAIKDLCDAFDKGLLPNSLDDEKYFNIKRMKSMELS